MATAVKMPPRKKPYPESLGPAARALNVVGDKWALLVVGYLLAEGETRFVEIQRGLDGISVEQLRTCLNRLVDDGVLERQRFREVPPRVTYKLTARGRALEPVLYALAVWGGA